MIVRRYQVLLFYKELNKRLNGFSFSYFKQHIDHNIDVQLLLFYTVLFML
jgi:hypothetical protein